MTKKTIVIVGANRGIGLELTRIYSLTDNVYALCRKTSVELANLNVKVLEGVDVRSLDSLQSCASGINEKVDMLIHNSGIMSDENLSHMDQAAFDRMEEQFLVNSLGPFKSVVAFGSLLKKGSKVGLMSSRMGSIEDNTSGGSYGYRASKTALNSIGKSLARDLEGQGVAVALLHPGYVQTDMTGGTGNLTAEESARNLSQVMNKLTLETTGRFWHCLGNELPW